MIEISKKKDYNLLLQDIREALEMKYEDLKGLQGLRVKELTIKNRIEIGNHTFNQNDTSVGSKTDATQ